MSYAAQNIADKAVEKYNEFKEKLTKPIPSRRTCRWWWGRCISRPSSRTQIRPSSISAKASQMYPKGKLLRRHGAGAGRRPDRAEEIRRSLQVLCKETLASNPAEEISPWTRSFISAPSIRADGKTPGRRQGLQRRAGKISRHTAGGAGPFPDRPDSFPRSTRKTRSRSCRPFSPSSRRASSPRPRSSPSAPRRRPPVRQRKR